MSQNHHSLAYSKYDNVEIMSDLKMNTPAQPEISVTSVAKDHAILCDLMKRYQNPDPKISTVAFETLYARFEGFVQRMIKNKLHQYSSPTNSQHQEVDDVVQLAWIKFHQTRALYLPEHPLEAWLRVIVKSVTLDYLKKNHRFMNRQNHAYEWQTLTQETQNNDTELQLDQLNQQLKTQLDPSELELVEQRYLEEQSYEAIAQRLQLNEPTVRKRLSRIIKKLKEGKQV
jgi:RNA polymerase sigma-70 factor (ECF subfamily)